VRNAYYSYQLKLDLFHLFNGFIIGGLLEEKANPVQMVREESPGEIQGFSNIILEGLGVQFYISNGLCYLHLAISQFWAHVSPPGGARTDLEVDHLLRYKSPEMGKGVSHMGKMHSQSELIREILTEG
jgi:hypothetical protein